MKNYQELRAQLVESYKKEYPLDFESGEAVDFEAIGDASEQSQFFNNICGDILDITFDDIADGNEEYCQVTYYSDELKSTVIIDSNVECTFENPDAVIDAMIEYQKDADLKEAGIFTAKLDKGESLAEKLAQFTLSILKPEHSSDSMDGDETALLAKNFLVELNKLMGNV